MREFCKENTIIPVDANQFCEQLQSDDERTLYQFYKDEITHLKAGGNLGVASDILRWLSPSYRLGSYTDLDVPLNTAHLPETVEVDAPLLLNISSLRMLGDQEMVLVLNEYIAVVDELAAKEHIERVHAALIKKLSHYSSDYIERTEEALNGGSFFNRFLLASMGSRPEVVYIKRSAELTLPDGMPRTSRNVRAYVNELMTNKEQYLNFRKRFPDESRHSVIQHLAATLPAALAEMQKNSVAHLEILQENAKGFFSFFGVLVGMQKLKHYNRY